MEGLGPRLKQLRLEAGASKAHVARVCGVSDVTVGYWENGQIGDIGYKKLVPLAREYHLTLSEVIGDSRQAPAHWTDRHILREAGQWVGYDEASQELCRNTSHGVVRDALVVYANNTLNSEQGYPR